MRGAITGTTCYVQCGKFYVEVGECMYGMNAGLRILFFGEVRFDREVVGP